MAPFALTTLALLFAVATAPASARPPGDALHGAAPHGMGVHLPLGRQANGSPPQTFKLSPATPRKIGPSPAPSPEYNPLKRRHLAMPAIDPENQLAF